MLHTKRARIDTCHWKGVRLGNRDGDLEERMECSNL